MSIIASSGRTFTPAPEGLWNATIVDVVDLGDIKTDFGTKHFIRLVMEIDHLMEDGKPFICSKRFTLSLHEKAGLRKTLVAIRGKQFTPDELKAFDLERCLGAPCQVVIEHLEKEGEIYGNVTSFLKGKKRMVPSGAYTRVINRDKASPYAPAPHGKATKNTPADAAWADFGEAPPPEAEFQASDSDIPF